MDHVWTRTRALALLGWVMDPGGDEGVVSLGTDNCLTDNWSARLLLAAIQIGNSGFLRGNSILQNTLLVLHPLELRSFLGLFIRELYLLGTLIGAHASGQVREPAVSILNQVGVGGSSIGLAFWLHVVFAEDFRLRVHGRKHINQPLLVRRLLDNLERGSLEG